MMLGIKYNSANVAKDRGVSLACPAKNECAHQHARHQQVASDNSSVFHGIFYLLKTRRCRPTKTIEPTRLDNSRPLSGHHTFGAAALRLLQCLRLNQEKKVGGPRGMQRRHNPARASTRCPARERGPMPNGSPGR